jgi:hypothetical protein
MSNLRPDHSDRYAHLFPGARETLAASPDETFRRAESLAAAQLAAHDSARFLRTRAAASNEAADLD